jgi:hypothetical protein
MRIQVSAVIAGSLIALLLVAGCADISAKQKVGDFGTAFGTSSEEQGAITWFITTYGDPRTNNDKPPRFIEPMITSVIDKNNLPGNKVTTFPVDGGSVYFFVIYDNFQKGDPITVTWTYLENGKQVSTVEQKAGGDFGRFIVEFQKPDSGWGKGNQEITVSGNGTSAKVDFTIGDSLQTTPLPYNPAGTGQTTGSVTLPVTTVTTLQGSSGSTGAVITTTTTRRQNTLKCGAGQIACNGKCVSTKSDLSDCDLSCSDGKKNNAETDVDCGGSFCTACDLGKSCTQNLDCMSSSCVNGVCAPAAVTPVTQGITCSANEVICNGQCVDTDSDMDNCGRCANSCSYQDTVCIQGICQDKGGPRDTLDNSDSSGSSPGTGLSGSQQTCPSGTTKCGGKCINFKTDSNNCGACGTACKAGMSCCAGKCVDLKTDSNHCGACVIICPVGVGCFDKLCVKPDLCHDVWCPPLTHCETVLGAPVCTI